MKYKPVIGLEIHTELKTKTKMFCDSLNDPDEKHPNINVCPICMGHPGTLPVINEEALKKVIMTGLVLNCKIQKNTFFERKNYFYPDLPKGYQISQYQSPLCVDGYLEIPVMSQKQNDPNLQFQNSAFSSNFNNNLTTKRIRITRIHLEEDAGRLYHLSSGQTGFLTKDYSLIDYNRAGVPLMELVTEPDLESGQEVKKFAEELQLLLRYLGVSDADMEKGQFRIEVNISLKPELPSSESQISVKNQAKNSNNYNNLGTKVEIKNLNSVKFAADAVDYEIKRQTEILRKGGKIIQETRGWDEQKYVTFSQRSKEEAKDYRYFPEPDLPPILFTDEEIETLRSLLPETPMQRKTRLIKQYFLTEKDAEIFTINKTLGDYFEHVASEIMSFDKLSHLKRPDSEHQAKLFKLASNYLITELKRMAAESDIEPTDTKITPEYFADLIVRIFHGEISSSSAQIILKEMFITGQSPEYIIRDKDLVQVSNLEELKLVVEKIINEYPKAVEDYQKGKEASLKFLVGMAMRITKGKANPQMVEGILKEKLK
jgi:aspartyl-tRNA(Asn)/glutamyl-tRNA(Gln) amidotransferase subunit B